MIRTASARTRPLAQKRYNGVRPMMARKLSVIARLTALSLAANLTTTVLQARAEGEIQATAPKAIFDNPYAPAVASQPTPRVVAVEPESAPRGPVTYQNPF